MDNAVAGDVAKVIQWNKHGGIYTHGNAERFPFGLKKDVTVSDRVRKWGMLDHTGFTTWGYSFYESLYQYGYFESDTPASLFSSKGCCSTAMGGKWGGNGDTPAHGQNPGSTNKAVSDATDKGWSTWGTPIGDVNHQVGNMYTDTSADTLTKLEWFPYANDACMFAATDAVAAAAIGTLAKTHACADEVTGKGAGSEDWGVGEARPYKAGTGDYCTPVKRGKQFGVGTDGDFKFCEARFATDFQAPIAVSDATTKSGALQKDGATYHGKVWKMNSGTGSAMKFPPMAVNIRVSDNDAIVDQTALTDACRQTRLFQYADASKAAYTAVKGSGVHKTEWLVDYNCKNGDAGGLPGYPAGAAIPGDAGIDGDAQCASGKSGPYCT